MKKATSLLEEHKIRNTKKQKTAFIQRICAEAASDGYVSEVEQKKSHSRNVVIGDVSEASVVFTAHYDTPSRSLVPSFTFPKMPWLTTLSRVGVGLAAVIPSFILFIILSLLLPAVGIPSPVAMLISIIIFAGALVASMLFVVGGMAREDNANSNTSGVLALLQMMEKMPAELRSKVAFVFLDNQEIGYVGAADFIKKHHKHGGLKDKLIVNLDTIGVGENIVVALSRAAKDYEGNISAALVSSDGFTVEIMHGAKHIPSDHIKFKNSICISAFKKNANGMLYIDNLTTAGDTECNGTNIDFVVKSCIKLAKLMNGYADDSVIEEKAAPEVIEEPKAEAETVVADEVTEAATETVPEEAAEAEESADIE